MNDGKKISIGESVVQFDDEGNVVQVSNGKSVLRFNEDGSIVAKTGETKFLMRPDDGIPGKLDVICENGHSLRVDMPANLQTLTAKAVNITNPCPLCGGKVSAPSGGYFARNEEGVFVHLSDMPS